METHRRRSCKSQDGEYLYHEWYCSECGTKYYEESQAKYCCFEDVEE
jgi:hypothetical protein